MVEGSEKVEKDINRRLAFLEGRVKELEDQLEGERDARKAQAMLASQNEVLLDMGGPIFLDRNDPMPSCLICSEIIRPGEWLFCLDTRNVLNMSPLLENVDGRSDNDFEFGLKVQYIHRKCFLVSIMNTNVDPFTDSATRRLDDPRYRKPYSPNSKTR